MSVKKILHIIPTVSPIYGGPSKAIRKITEILHKSGWDISVATTTGDGGNELDVPLNVPVDEKGVTYYYFRRQNPKSITFSMPLLKWLMTHAKEYDILHIHSLFNFPSLIACLISRFFKIPYVIRPLGTLDMWSLSQKSWKKKPYYYLLERNNILSSSAIHVTSNAELESIKKIKLDDKAYVIPIGIDIPENINLTENDDEILKILYLSRLHHVKNIPLLLRAAAELKKRGRLFLLTIAGDGEPAYVNLLKKQVSELNIGDCINFTGFVEGSLKEKLFLDSHLFVLPSFQENFGVAIAEAMAYGLPVIISDRVAMSDLVKKENIGHVVPVDDYKKLAQAVEEYYDKTKCLSKGIKARKIAKIEFSINKMGYNLSNMYQYILNES